MVEEFFREDIVFEVDPNTIIGHVPDIISIDNRKVKPKYFFVVNGDWDLDSNVLNQHPTDIEMEDLIHSGYEYEKSNTHRELIERLENEDPKQHRGGFIDSRRKIDEYCNRYLSIYMDMLENGYVRERLSGEMDAEIGVAVGRDGRILHFRKGHHRLALAKLAALPSVVVSVRFVHPLWLRRCVERHGMSLVTAIRKGIDDLHQTPPTPASIS
jgi:hypothetical protein